MPAKSAKQRRFMAAVANNPKFAKEVGVPQAVGEEFMKTKKMESKGYKVGGQMKEKSKFPDLNEDGEVTQADILMGKGVVKKKAGGMMKSKGYRAGGNVRGAGCAQRGVRPAKMR